MLLVAVNSHAQINSIPDSTNNRKEHTNTANTNCWQRTEFPLKSELEGKTINFASLTAKTEVTKDQLTRLYICKGTIYFVGVGFPNPVSIILSGFFPSSGSIYDRIVPGTRIVFDKAILWNDDGTKTQPITKSFVVK